MLLLSMGDLISVNANGLYCAKGDFYIDAWRGVDRNIVTHAHSDHARRGSKSYLSSLEGAEILRERLGQDCAIDSTEYGRVIDLNGVRVSLHPAGHVRGSSQVRVESAGEVWVVSGDYKRQSDPTCTAFELLRCHTFITESTFGLPIYRWRDPDEIMNEVNAWWRRNVEEETTSILFAYTLGKAQRLLARLDPEIGPILLHGAMVPMVKIYREGGVKLPETLYADPETAKLHRGKAIVIAPSSSADTPWMRKFAPYSTASASGWMQVRGMRRRRAIDRGFVLSDHVDWPGLLQTIEETGCERAGITHGFTSAVCRYLSEKGVGCFAVPTRFEGEGADEGDEALPVEEPA